MSEAGLYLHIPFCKRKCPYCHFFSITDLGFKGLFVAALREEMALYRNTFPPFSTIYFGGGTPSLLSAPEIEEILKGVEKEFSLIPDMEITLEVNPLDQDEDWYWDLNRMGVNRLVIGVQSLHDVELARLGRQHRAKDAIYAIEKARKAGFNNIGVDLIYGLPGQSLADWEKNLKEVVSLAPEHISCYELTLEEDTPFYEMAKEGKLTFPKEEEKWKFFALTHWLLTEQGFLHYEVSNFARGWSRVSRHNFLYWQRKPYLGCGPSAHSFDGERRWWNVSSLETYLAHIKKNTKPISGAEIISPAEASLEEIFLGLRTCEGIKLEALKEAPLLSPLLAEGYLKLEASHIRPTLKGMACADQLAIILTPDSYKP